MQLIAFKAASRETASCDAVVCCYPVNDASRVQMPDATEDLVQEIRHPFMVQVHVDDLTQVCIHQLHHKVTTRQGMKRKNEAAQRSRTHSNHITFQRGTVSKLL